MTRFRALTIVIAAAMLAFTAGTRAQSPQEEVILLDLPSGKIGGALRMPSKISRPPVVYLASDARISADLIEPLAALGVAALRKEVNSADAGPVTAEIATQWVTHLRNDARFPVVVVFGDGSAVGAAAIAARAARADGLITHGERGSAAEEVARLVAPSTAATGGSTQEIAEKIATFAKNVPAFGRRGAAAVRPPAGRRSLRHTVMTKVGSVRVAVEWGQPQMRGREIWGALVPWNEVWMPGADEATTLTTDGPVTLGTFDIPAGDHTLFANPTADKFELLISRDVGQFHTQHDLTKIIGRVEMTMTERAASVEGLTFAIEAGLPGTFKLMWDKREYAARLAAK